MSADAARSIARRANRALDAANFFLADVRDGLGPYLAIYLLTVQKWDEASVGVVMSIATAAGILAQTPAAVSLGIVGHRAFSRRVGRNEFFNHAAFLTLGAVAAAALALFAFAMPETKGGGGSADAPARTAGAKMPVEHAAE